MTALGQPADGHSKPLVSILVPTYNGARFLRQAIDSILAQTYADLEVILLDDASTDETAEIAAAYADRVQYVRQPANLGIYANVNDGLGRARGEFVATYHADDIYLPTIVEAQVAYFEAHPEVGAVFCSDIFVDAEGREYGRLALPREVRGEQPLAHATVVNALLRYKNRFLVCPTAMVRASVYREVGRYDQSRFRNTADLEMWLRISRRYRLAVLESHLMKYRHFHNSSSQRYHRLRTTPENYFGILDAYLETGDRPLATPAALVSYEAHRSEDRLMAAISHYVKGDRTEGRRALGEVRLESIASSPEIQRWRLMAIFVGLWVLLRLPRFEPAARLMYQRWHVKRPPRDHHANVHRPQLQSVIGIGVMQFAAMSLLLARTKILALMLGPGAIGLMSVVDRLTALISQALSLSLPFAALRYLPAVRRESPTEMDALYRRMRAVLLTLILPGMVVCLALSVYAPAVWGRELLPYRLTVLLAFAGLPVVAVVPFLVNAYAANLTHTRSMTVSVAHSAVFAIAAIAAAAGLGLRGYYGVYAGLGTVLILMAMRLLPSVKPGDRMRLTARQLLSLPARVWRFMAALIAVTVAAPYAALFLQMTTMRLYGVEASGIVQSAIGLSLIVRTFLGTSHAVLLTPHVNSAELPHDRMRWANDFQRTTVVLLVMALPPLLLFSDLGLRLFYSAKFAPAASFVALFIAAETVTLLSGTYQALILAADRLVFHVVQNLLAQGLLVGIAAVALPRLGLAGAGLATLAAPVFLFVTTVAFLRYGQGLKVSPEATIMAAITVAVLVVCGIAGSRVLGLTPLVLLSKTGICVVAWLLAFGLMPREDRSRLVGTALRLRQQVQMLTGGAIN